MAIQVGGTTVINNSRVLSNVTGLKTVNNTSILGSGNITAGGNIASAFTVSASSSASLNNSTSSITTTGGAGTYMIQVSIFGQNGGNPYVILSSTNVSDGIFDNAIWDGGTPTFTNGQISSGDNSISLSFFGLIRTSGNITITRAGSANSVRRVSWGLLA